MAELGDSRVAVGDPIGERHHRHVRIDRGAAGEQARVGHKQPAVSMHAPPGVGDGIACGAVACGVVTTNSSAAGIAWAMVMVSESEELHR